MAFQAWFFSALLSSYMYLLTYDNFSNEYNIVYLAMVVVPTLRLQALSYYGALLRWQCLRGMTGLLYEATPSFFLTFHLLIPVVVGIFSNIFLFCLLTMYNITSFLYTIQHNIFIWYVYDIAWREAYSIAVFSIVLLTATIIMSGFSLRVW